MKSTGIVRKIDELGRIVIPKEIRRIFDLEDKIDSLEIFTDDNMIILKKYEPCCIFCKGTNKLQDFEGRNICGDCVEKILLKNANQE